MNADTTVVQGQESWRVATHDVEAFVTRVGGHLGPVTFERQGRGITPLSVAPWAEEVLDPGQPALLRVLRGDFFTLPFGGNETPYDGERHPFHGETAQEEWRLEDRSDHTLHLSLEPTVRNGRVDKRLRLREGHQAVYQQHVISGMSGPMPLGHHVMVRFPDRAGSGVLSTSPFVHGQVFPGEFERADQQGYQSLRSGAEFASLDKVALATGGETDLTRYPARRGYEDLAMLVADASLPFAWTAIVFAAERYVWFAVRDPRVLRSTILWISNGGRYSAPWNGRHVNVLGVEDVTAFFHSGLAESAGPNSINGRGFPTVVDLDPENPLVVNHIMGVCEIPAGFDRVTSMEAGPEAETITLTADSGQSCTVALDLGFLTSPGK